MRIRDILFSFIRWLPKNISSAHKILCEGQGACDNNTRCICDENYGGLGLHFDVGDTDCPTHLLAFRALAYIQFGCGKVNIIFTM